MARTVRVIDSPEYARLGGIRPDVEVVETDGGGLYGRRFVGRDSLVFILILVLIVVWIYWNRGVGFFGDLVNETPNAEISAAGVANPVESEVPSVVPPVVPPFVGDGQQSDVIGYTRVAADRLNLRAGPGFQYNVIYILPRDWEVAILRQSHITPDGEAWVQVMVNTDQGWQKGWVIQRYLESW